jgi:hypothetical protein
MLGHHPYARSRRLTTIDRLACIHIETIHKDRKKAGKPGFVMEFKVLGRKETPEQALQRAAKQVREWKYADAVRAVGASVVYQYAMVFDGKLAWVKRVEDLLAPRA